MVSRFTLIFWRWVVVLHDRLHDARNKTMETEFDDTNVSYNYLASRRRN